MVAVVGGGDKVVMLKPEGASYYLMDACALGFPAESFDAVVDKGTLDAMLSIGDEADSWYPARAAIADHRTSSHPSQPTTQCNSAARPSY